MCPVNQIDDEGENQCSAESGASRNGALKNWTAETESERQDFQCIDNQCTEKRALRLHGKSVGLCRFFSAHMVSRPT